MVDKINYANATNEELIKEYVSVANACFISDMSSDSGSLGSGRDRDLFSYEYELLMEIRKRNLLEQAREEKSKTSVWG